MKNTGATIAVVEDDEGVRTALQQLLRSAGFCAVAFESAEEFLADANKADVECLIVDVNLPGISGVDLLKRLGTNGHRLPVVLITGSRDAATAELVRQVADVPRLHKPFSDEALFEIIERLLLS